MLTRTGEGGWELSEGRRFGTARQERPAVAEWETEERIHPHLPHDDFYRDQETLTEWGLGDAVHSCVADLVYQPGHPKQGEFVFPGTRVLVSVTPPSVADRIDPGLLTRKKLARKSFKIAKYPEGHPQAGEVIPSIADQVYATYDRDEYLNQGRRSKRFHNEQALKFTQGVINRKITRPGSTDASISQFDDSQLMEQKEKAREWMRNVGGPKYPATMPLEDIERHEGAEKIRRMEAKFARGRMLSNEEWEKRVEWEGKRGESRKPAEKNRTVSFPNSPTK